jgi:nucleoside-diphosphate-sugar epimerase
MLQNSIGSTKNASKDLGFEYELDLQQGLKDLIAWRESNSDSRK